MFYYFTPFQTLGDAINQRRDGCEEGGRRGADEFWPG